MTDILKLFEGLDEQQARKFRKAIMPTLQELRQRIITENEQGESEQRLQNGKMHSKNPHGRTVQNAGVEGE
jgi:hypothetical protein